MPDKRLPADFDGTPVVKTTVAIRKAGDGLSQAMAADAQTIHMGERVIVTIECECSGVNVRPLDKDDPAGPLVVSYVLTATSRATIMDDELVAAALDAQQKRNDLAAGRPQLDLDADGIPAALADGDDPARVSPGLVSV